MTHSPSEQSHLFPEERQGEVPVALRQTWETPKLLFTHLDDTFKFTLDVAAETHNAKAPNFYTWQQDGLKQPWGPGQRVWCNPPFKTIQPWVVKGLHAMRELDTLSVFLVPASVDTSWFHKIVMPHSLWWLFQGRINFRPPSNAVKNDSGPSFGCMLILMDPKEHRSGFAGSRCPKTGRVLFDATGV